MIRIIIYFAVAIGIAVTTVLTHNKVNKSYICDSIIDCNSRDTLHFNVKVYNNNKRIYKPIKSNK
jgi:hypothetical protein